MAVPRNKTSIAKASTSVDPGDCHLQLATVDATLRARSGNLARGNLFEGLRGLPQSGRSCSEVESELHVARGEIERNKVTGGVTVMAVVEYHAVRRCRF